MTQITRLFLTLVVLSFSPSSGAIELLDANIPAALKNAYHGRYKNPDACIETTTLYIKNQQAFYMNSGPITDETEGLATSNILPTQLLAFCYTQVKDYTHAYQLLTKQLKQLSFSAEQLRTLNILASEVPKEKRPEFNNQLLIKIFTTSIRKIEVIPFTNAPNLKAKLLLTVIKLSLESDQYRNANLTLESAKEELKTNKSIKLHAWLAYYYGLYYENINQQQLAISNLFAANKLANKHNFIKLSGESKKSIANLYQKKHLFNRAIDFASQRVELYINTKNSIKQADSLIQLAILKERNNEQNQSLIYLFNALELIQNKKHSSLLAHVYLELGRTYSSHVFNKENQKERLLAQKYLQNARYHFTRLKESRYQVESLLLLARLNLINDDPALAILQLEKILRLSLNNYPELRVQAFEMLASSYEITGNHQQAILHFKNFHALQNRIKERLFTLQQLKINEQLQLVERTQQQRQLEIKNSELETSNARFKTLTYSTITLLVITLLSFFYILIRNRKLIESENRSQRQLTHHPRTGLPSQQAQGNEFNYIYHDKPLYYALISIPFLARLNELSGVFSGAELEKKLGQALRIFFTNSADIFQIRDNQILFISEQQDHQSAENFAQKIEAFFTLFADKYHLPNALSIGIVAFPFLNNVSRAITPTRMLNLSSLALFGASQLRESYQENSWLELVAIDNLQPAFFDGDLWELGQRAIQKGIVKVNCSHQSHQFYWPELEK
ncbi:tetratricopeptide repeat protein [Psychromonas hadalis]|uniref:tetratricopeptide repeat protein n=1 Tax=Psychromonas hadalis TaxID=211669 RepID=UPI0003B71A92|nr:GGDEF domain-containing protein [Psychromonas hadalis]